ncbi:MAG TPA: serine hydrolase domain-containing protein [Clostridia bacterium]|nr:serine hydrolase domain-containing protein [Clostridia bacterium]
MPRTDDPVSPAGRRTLQDALEAWSTHHGVPGATVTVADAQGGSVTAVSGLADVATGEAVEPGHRFQIGSIGKSLTAITLLRLAEGGRLDPADPVRRSLPWFETSLRREITLHELLTHTSGLPMGGDFSESGWFDAWTLRDVGPGGRPGRWSYSNVGYKVLGLAIEAIAGSSYGDAVHRAILEPLGMTDSRATVHWTGRAGEVTGYEPAPDAYPMSRAPRVPAPWMDLTTGDGSTSASGPDMGRYLSMLLRGGSGPRGPVIGEPAFARLIARHVRIRPGLWSGYGFARYELDGSPAIGHGGDMVGFGSSLVADTGNGLGAVVLANLRDAPCRPLTLFALRLARAERGLGPAPRLDLDTPVDPALRFAGRDAVDDARLEIGVEAGTAWAAFDGRRVPLIATGVDEFEVDDPVLGRFPLILERDGGGDPGEGAPGAVILGGARFTSRPPARAPSPFRPSHRAAVGRYRSHNPWRRTFDVVERHGRLLLIEANGMEDGLAPRGHGLFRVGGPGSPEWIRFDAVVAGRALRASATGHPYYRTA